MGEIHSIDEVSSVDCSAGGHAAAAADARVALDAGAEPGQARVQRDGARCGRGYVHVDRGDGQGIAGALYDGAVSRHDADGRLLLQAQGVAQLSVREGPAVATLSWRARAASLPERRGALHRVQAV